VVSASIPSSNTGYPDWIFRSFLQFFQADLKEMSYNRSRRLPSAYFLIHNSESSCHETLRNVCCSDSAVQLRHPSLSAAGGSQRIGPFVGKFRPPLFNSHFYAAFWSNGNTRIKPLPGYPEFFVVFLSLPRRLPG